MDTGDAQSRRLAQEEARRQGRIRRARLGALVSLLAVIGVLIAIISSSSGGSSSSKRAASTGASTSTSTTAAPKPTTTAVPILTYYVINSAPPGSSAPADLYVPVDQFTSQMNALKAQGWHAVTLDQLEAYWTHGKPLGPGKPIVITFDNGYASQYANALPVLKGLGWVAVANLQVNGLSATDGGMSDTQIRGLIAAGWEIDAEGVTHIDLTSAGPATLQQQTTGARQALSGRYNVPVNWFAYPLGNYDANVVAAVRSAGFLGATTIVPGWAGAQEDRYRLPRLQVPAGTTPTKLLSQIAAAEHDSPPPDSYSGTGIA